MEEKELLLLLPNETFFIMLGIFFASYAVLKALVFGPYLRLLENREAKTIGLKEKAGQDRELAEKLKAEYETQSKADRRKVAAWMDEQRKNISDEERQIVQEARNTVGAELKHLREGLHAETDRVRAELLPLVNEYSSQLASKLLGHKVKVSGSLSDQGKAARAETTVPG